MRRESEKHIWEKFLADLARADSSLKVEKLLKLFITEDEREQIVKRAAAISMLNQGKSYRQIGEMLWLSSSTISAIKKSLQSGKGYVSRHALWKVKGRKKKQFSAFSQQSNEKIYLPYGKLFYYRKRRR